MRIIKSIVELRSILHEYKSNGEKIGLVPTMGFLHKGHLSLVEQAKEKASIVVMSIFVNPLQFGPNEDFDKYPRDIERDSGLASENGVDILFVPEVSEMYPQQSKTTVSVQGITSRLCGASRPGHFDGVATVVTKLFMIVQPDYAFFGLKDAQQIAVIQQMVSDLNIPVTIVPCPIIREADGLALSSRNVYLKPEERKQALILSESLQQAERDANLGLPLDHIRENIIALIKSKPLAQIDYVEILSYPSLEPIKKEDGKDFIIALAVRYGNTRLIDNKIIAAREESHLDAKNAYESKVAQGYSN